MTTAYDRLRLLELIGGLSEEEAPYNVGDLQIYFTKGDSFTDEDFLRGYITNIELTLPIVFGLELDCFEFGGIWTQAKLTDTSRLLGGVGPELEYFVPGNLDSEG